MTTQEPSSATVTTTVAFPELHDAELTALGGVLAVLRHSSLTPEGRRRIADYLKSRFDSDVVNYRVGNPISNV